MTSLPTREDQKKRVRWANTQRGSSERTHSSSSPDTNSKDLRLPLKTSTHGNVSVEGPFIKPAKAPTKASISITKAAPHVPLIPALHPVLSYFVFNWDVRAAQFPDSLPKAARDEPAFPRLDFPKPITVCFETPLGASTCLINPLERDGKPIPINVGRVLACISRELYTAIEPTALSLGHPMLRAVHEAAASRAYDPEPDRNRRIARNVDLYPVPPVQRNAPLFFWYIELQHCAGGAVRLVARFGPRALKAVV